MFLRSPKKNSVKTWGLEITAFLRLWRYNDKVAKIENGFKNKLFNYFLIIVNKTVKFNK